MALNVLLQTVYLQQMVYQMKQLCLFFNFVIKLKLKVIKKYVNNVKKDMYKQINVYHIMQMVVNIIKYLMVQKILYVFKLKDVWKLIIMYQNVKQYQIIKYHKKIVQKYHQVVRLVIVDFIMQIVHVCNVKMILY